MDAELMAKWIAALRSEKFTQCQGKLSNDSRSAFCCLGVLAIISNPNADLDEEEGRDPYTELDKMIGSQATRLNLVRLNDKEGKTFPEIAEWIEQKISSGQMIAEQCGEK